MNETVIKEILRKCWSLKSSTLWTENNPARGQCNVTALVIQDCFGGKIFKTKVSDKWHFYNSIDGLSYDFTAEQFESPVEYLDLPATREEALADLNINQYAYLSTRFKETLAKIPSSMVKKNSDTQD
ncbi:hypothetical protein [Brasilonema sp. UFV-L1]|uniref:YunG family protein n=1 Tax=Brasilonema sp. UFV-L1 TaxID=2234130 RepID=UPI00145D47FA|nr:hypothetical protein [Brasilonema sp. UFV-L1]NMG08230.1 hypothetical protein [Brasilonema sp. UFV-L1]